MGFYQPDISSLKIFLALKVFVNIFYQYWVLKQVHLSGAPVQTIFVPFAHWAADVQPTVLKAYFLTKIFNFWKK